MSWSTTGSTSVGFVSNFSKFESTHFENHLCSKVGQSISLSNTFSALSNKSVGQNAGFISLKKVSLKRVGDKKRSLETRHVFERVGPLKGFYYYKDIQTGESVARSHTGTREIQTGAIAASTQAAER